MKENPIISDLTLLRPIGRGSYGEVWIARTLTGVYRAVKVVYRSRFADDRPFLRELDGITRFQRSAGDQPRQLALMHVGSNDADGFFYYVMELADDVERGTDIDPAHYEPHTLKAQLERDPFLPAERVVRLGIELARALGGLHDADLIHRDVKPSNIIFVAGAPKIADIGLVSSSDHTLTSLGTPGYSPPEGAGTVRADLYSLGRVLYELVSGRSPNDFPLLPRDLDRRKDMAVILELNEVILRACASDPKDRYANATEMLDDLLLVEAGKSVQELFRMRRRLKSLGRAAAIAGAAAAVVMAGLGVQNYFALRKLAAAENRARVEAEQNERLARYTADLNLAQLAISAGDFGRARTALRRGRKSAEDPGSPGLEWHALWNDTRGDSVRTLGDLNGRPVTALMLSAGRNRIAAQEGDSQRTTVVWDLNTGQRREIVDGSFRLGSFLDNGNRLIVGGADGTLRSIDLATGASTSFAQPRSGLIEQEANSGSIVTARRLESGFELTRWDLQTLTVTNTWTPDADFPANGYSADVLDHQGERIAIVLTSYLGADRVRQLRVIDLTSGETVFQRDDIPNVACLAFSPDERFLAMAAAGEPIALLDASTGATIRTFAGHVGDIFDLEFSPDGTQLASAGGDQTVRIWDAGTGTSLRVLRDHEGEITTVRWTGASQLATASRDGTIRLWDLQRSQPPSIRSGFWDQALGDLVYDMATRTWFATVDSGGIAPLDGVTMEPSGDALPGFHPLAFDGGELIALTRDLRLVRVAPATGEVTEAGLSLPGDDVVLKAVASPTAGVAAFGLEDGSVTVWDYRAEAVLADGVRHQSGAFVVAVDPRGSRVASGGWDGSIVMWRRDDGSTNEISPAGSLETTALEFSPDGERLAVGRSDGSLELVQVDSGQSIRRAHPHTQAVAHITFGDDGRRIISGGYDGTVVMLAAPSLRQLVVVPVKPYGYVGDDFAVSRVRLAEDGSSLLVLTQDGHLRRWLLGG